MKFFITGIAIWLMLLSSGANAQNGNSNNYIPELVFQNPVLISGTAGQDGAIYRFSNVADDLDATVKLKARSSSAVVLTNIDVADLGWNKAFQPQLGIQGNVPANQNWWMEFEMRFYKAGTNNKKKVKGFKVTAIDVDGDGVSIQEYVQMNKTKSTTYCPVNYLVESSVMNWFNDYDGDDDDGEGNDKNLQGPVQNFVNIDTAGTNVMATFSYENKDMITFRYGAKSGTVISNAGERLNSLWFKAFDLSVPKILPVTFHSFTALFEKKNVLLSWMVDTDETFPDYTVERSTDGKNFSAIGLVLTTGQPGTNNNYQFKDMNVSTSTGIIYYRLKWLSMLKETTYSSIKIVRPGKDDDGIRLTAYPNPVKNDLYLTLPGTWQSKPVLVEIYSAGGSLLKSYQVEKASQTENVQLPAMQKGFYLVKVTCDGQSAQQQIIKN